MRLKWLAFFKKLGAKADKTINESFYTVKNVIQGNDLNEKLKPNKNKNPFQNYSDHFKMMTSKLEKDFSSLNHFISNEDYDGALLHIDDMLFERLTMLSALHDGHDYVDEIGRATVAPLIFLGSSLANAANSLFQGVSSLINKDELASLDAKKSIFTAATYFLLSIECLINSSISLITRPVATLANGFESRTEAGFYDTPAPKT